MTADIIPMPQPKGNGAREALMGVLLLAAVTNDELAPVLTDFVLGELYLAGFKIVPMEEKRSNVASS